MSRIAGVVLTTAAFFLLVVAVLLNSPALFYMSTAMIATIAASRFQAYLAVRGLKFERFAPEVASLGDEVIVDIVVLSQRRVRRPLIQVFDELPDRLIYGGFSPAMPIAPSFGEPVKTQYRFRPLRRGIFRWDKLTVVGTDALGIISLPKEYSATPAALTVLPSPVPISFELPASAGFGFADTEHGHSGGSGIQPRGIREYTPGDALRYVHWPSTARRGQLLVKEFEVGAHAGIALIFQMTKGTDIGEGANTTFELMCGHAAHLIEWHVQQGVEVSLPGLEDYLGGTVPYERERSLLRVLASLNADADETLSQQIRRTRQSIETGATVCLFLTVAEDDLPSAIADLSYRGHRVTALVYDPATFFTTRSQRNLRSAAQGDYIDKLRASGAYVHVPERGGLK